MSGWVRWEERKPAGGYSEDNIDSKFLDLRNKAYTIGTTSKSKVGPNMVILCENDI